MSIADQYERYMLALINDERAEVGAAPLRLDVELNVAAAMHALWMLETGTFSHTGAEDSTPKMRMEAAGFDFVPGWASAENIAVQTERGAADIWDDVYDLHVALMNSPGHRANLLNADLDWIGLGIEAAPFAYSSGTYPSVIVTQVFASTAAPTLPDPGPVWGTIQNGSGRGERLVGDGAGNEIRGWGGQDRIDARGGSDIVYGGAGNDTIELGRGHDIAHGERGNDVIDGGRGNDSLHGGIGNDRLFGDRGADHLYGGHGNDRLHGRQAPDVLEGGPGDDVLIGGGQRDVFVFLRGGDNDRILDFRDNTDTIDLSDFGFETRGEAMGFARQVGADVVFDFGGGDTLTIVTETRGVLTDDLIV